MCCHHDGLLGIPATRAIIRRDTKSEREKGVTSCLWRWPFSFHQWSMKSRLFSIKAIPLDHGYDLIRDVEWMAIVTDGRGILSRIWWAQQLNQVWKYITWLFNFHSRSLICTGEHWQFWTIFMLLTWPSGQNLQLTIQGLGVELGPRLKRMKEGFGKLFRQPIRTHVSNSARLEI